MGGPGSGRKPTGRNVKTYTKKYKKATDYIKKNVSNPEWLKHTGTRNPFKIVKQLKDIKSSKKGSKVKAYWKDKYT